MRAVFTRMGSRAKKPFALNRAAISPTLVEPTLFGYSKGAFTGANTARSGYFEDANDGTLFLDEIGELPFERAGNSCALRTVIPARRRNPNSPCSNARASLPRPIAICARRLRWPFPR